MNDEYANQMIVKHSVHQPLFNSIIPKEDISLNIGLIETKKNEN